MALPFGTRFKNAWNAFWDRIDPMKFPDEGHTSWTRPDRVRYTRGHERTIIASIINRIANDVASIDIRHVKLDENGRFLEEVNSRLNQALSIEANIDQTGRAMVHDAVSSLLDEGVIAIIPFKTTKNPEITDSFDVIHMRIGKILEWKPRRIKVDVYNDLTGAHEEIYVSKRYTPIIENPFYSVMNEANSTMRRLCDKLNILDKLDTQLGANKLDLIIQLPYVVKGQTRKDQANQRREEIERQLTGSRYGIAWIDGTERVTQLNRPIENTLLNQVQYLTEQTYAQLGVKQEILDGSADEKTMLNYQSRIVEPIVLAITEEMTRKFLSPTARAQRQIIGFFNDPFRLVPVSQMAEIADKFTRNEIMTGNEIRQSLGIKPSKDPTADELRNKNLSAPKETSTSDVSDKVQAMIKRLDNKNQNEEESE